MSLDAQVEPNNPVDKYVVYRQKSVKVVQHLKKGEKVSGSRYNLGDGEILQVSCKLKPVGQKMFIDLSQDELIKLKEIYTKKL